jgi:hypothetical protein
MKKLTMVIMTYLVALSGCVSLTYQEKQNLAMLKQNGISVDRAIGGFEEPNSRLVAGLLNILPGVGNFYLALGHGNDSDQFIYGFANILLWPSSIVWAVPQGAIDAGALNEREMLYHYRYNEYGKKALKERGLKLD